MKKTIGCLLLASVFLWGGTQKTDAEVILQYFQMPWRSLTQKMPELAEVGYSAMWLPPPTKASGGMSVGYDLWDPFDLGGKYQRGSVRTFYGTEDELHEMIRTAHRFGIRVYFDNIMNHRAFDVPGYNETTPIDIYPGMLPEDFHLRVTEDGFYRKWDNTRDWNDEWQVLHLGLSDLIDIAHEAGAGGWNHNHGPYEGAHHPGIVFVRHPDNPEYYAYDPEGNYVGFGNVTQDMLDNNPWAYEEDVNAYLIRAVRWKMDRTKADGLRLDAVKHVPAYFFGEPGNDASTAGYIGGMQLQFNKTRGFNQQLGEHPNFRETVFDTEKPRNDAMVFGEHLGAPPGFGQYIAAGMRLKDAPLRDHLNGILGSPWGSLDGMDETGWNPNPDFSPVGHQVGVQFAHSHDSDYAAARELQYAFYMTRAGLPIVYTDGYFKAGTLQDAGGAFPRHANTAFLGQFNDPRLPNLAYIHEHFARGYQYGRWSDDDVVAYARVDKRDQGWGVNDDMDDRSAAVMLFMMNDNYADGQNRNINPVFGHTSGIDDSWLMNYSTYGGPFYVWASQINNGEITIPPGGYFVFSWRSPEESDLWKWGGGNAVEIRQNNEVPGTVSYLRRDGPDGDSQFNPLGLEHRGFDSEEEANENPFRYRMTVPRVTCGTNLTFRAHVDGSAYDVLMKLNGGVDLNHHLGMGPSDGWGNRDRSPGNANDTFLGWEDTQFAGRFWPEKFGSVDAARNKIGSAGAEAYQFTVGESGFTLWESEASNDWDNTYGPVFVYHNPEANTDDDRPQMNPMPQDAVGQDIKFEVKTGHQGDANRVFLYYTTDGTWPEGAGGFGIGSTKVTELFWRTNVTENGGGNGNGGNGGLAVDAADNSGNYGGNWSDGSNGGTGFGAWSFNHTQGSGSAGVFIGDPNDAEISGMGSEAFGFWANPEGSGANAEVTRSFSGSWPVGTVFSFDLGLNWDSDIEGSNRGFNLYAGGTELININMGDSEEISINGDPLFDNHGVNAMTLSFEYVASGSIRVWGTGRDGSETYDQTLTVASGAPDNFKFYFNATEANEDRRQMYFDNLSLTVPPEPAGSGIGVMGEEVNDWWAEGTIPAQPADTMIRYKVSAVRQQGHAGAGWDVPFPNHPDQVARKYSMMGVWQITNFNAETIEYFPHNDYAQDLEGNPLMETGLQEGMNFIQVRAFLERPNGAAIFNTFKQTFYLDLERPTGEVKFPAEYDTLPSQEYGVVVRTDPTVTEVWFNIEDSDPENDSATHGNGTNELGQAHWAQAREVTPSLDIDSEYEREWRFTYRNIPSEGQATIRVLLRELSSSTNLHLTEEEGHYTILERNVNTDAPELRFFFDWPTEDGQVLEEGWTMRVHFEESLGFGIDDETLLDRFLIRINGAPQPRDAYNINRSIGDDLGSLEYDMPQLYNGNPDFDHLIQVTHVTGAEITLQTTRSVRAAPVPLPPTLIVTRPEQFDSDGRQTVIVLPDIPDPDPEDREYTILVTAASDYQHVWIEFEGDRGQADYISGPVTNGSDIVWTFNWTNMTAGTFVFFAHGNTNAPNTNEISHSNMRSIPVVLRQIVDQDDSGDSDDDGIPDHMEVTQTPLPEDLHSDFWTSGDVHMWRITGRTDPLMPNTDGGGLPDGLQLGLVGPIDTNATDITVDTNADGYKNFIPSLDPPLFNTKPDSYWHPDFREFAGRTDQITGSMTDPTRPDTDGDGLRDSEEDLNRNGRVDIGLLGLDGKVESILMHPDIPTVYNSSRVDRGRLPGNAIFLETDPNNPDTIGDGLMDGQADVSRNGRVNMYLLHSDESTEVLDYTDWEGDFFQFNRMPDDLDIIYWDNNNEPSHIPNAHLYDFAPIISRAVHYEALFAAYNREGTGTAQSGGWPKLLITETDPLVIDTIGDGLPDGWKVRYGLDPLDDGVYNWRTGEPGDPLNGPDGDLTGDGVTNMDHFLNGTDPRLDVTYVPPAGSIEIGRGDPIGVINGVTNYQEFIQWTWDDLLALDPYHGAGFNHQGGDIYRAWDGWDNSRDLVAFYARDGGAPPEGSGRFYFRLDVHDLQAFAEQGEVDYYIVINFGDMSNPTGERVLPDEVDTLTDMRWKVVVAIYESGIGMVYVDEEPLVNTDVFGQDLFTHGGVVPRGEYYLGAYFNSELDAVEVAIDRDALTTAGWSGLDPTALNYQVYSVKSGTQNDPQGPGDIGGRSDIRDSILNDWIAEDHWNAQAGLQGSGSVLLQWIPGDSQPGRVKVASIIHANQAIQPGSVIQDLINNNEGAGYYRPLATHDVFGQPLNLHITPTLASAIQWAKVDPAAEAPWRDGPGFNAWIRDLIETNTVHLLASTFSDHMLPYFTHEFNRDNVELANQYLHDIYGVEFDTNSAVFWTPERLLDADVFDKIKDMGFRYTVVDQLQHIWHWVGRTPALGDAGYQINRFHDVGTFAINNLVNDFRYSVHDSGAPMQLRQIFNRKARSGSQDQVVVLLFHWEEFLDSGNADAYDTLIRWIANRPWVEMVALEDITRGEVDLSGDGVGNAFWQHDRGSDPDLVKMANNWVQFATRGNYDNWYVGQPSYREGLEPKVFQIRDGVDLPAPYGMLFTGGIISNAWDAVLEISEPSVRDLARPVMHASVFQTAFHDQPFVDLRKFSTGDYLFPDNEAVVRPLASFAKIAQAQTRMAAIYHHVDQWAAAAPDLETTMVEEADVNLSGENEYLLGNNKLLGIFSRMGGRMIAAFARDPESGRILQVAGNLASFAGSETEWEGESNVVGEDDNVGAHRTSGFKDWWDGSQSYVNNLYTVTPTANGWQLQSSDNKITKTITLAPDSDTFQADYSVTGGGTLYIRHGMSPDLHYLLRHGQTGLSTEAGAGEMSLSHSGEGLVVRAFVDHSDANVAFNAEAEDGPFQTVNMRNQAQTHQVELEATGASFSFGLGFEIMEGELFNDGVPYTWLADYYPDPAAVNVHALAANQVNTIRASFIAGLNPTNPNAVFTLDELEEMEMGDGFILRWQSVSNRVYHILRTPDLTLGKDGFSQLADNVVATPPVNEYEDTDMEGETMFFYRIGVEYPGGLQE